MGHEEVKGENEMFVLKVGTDNAVIGYSWVNIVLQTDNAVIGYSWVNIVLQTATAKVGHVDRSANQAN
jgi:hypothetical protein